MEPSSSRSMPMNGITGATVVTQLRDQNCFEVTVSSQAYLKSDSVSKTRALVAELCRHFYTLGWVLGTGGSITIKVHDDSVPKPHQLIVMSPSGVQKERMVAEDMYVLSSDGILLSSPPLRPYPHQHPKCTDCAPIFMKAYEMRDAGAVIHSHGIEACLVTMMNPFSKEFRISHMEMIKGIQGHGYHSELVLPIIENAAHEAELMESFLEAINSYPKATAVLVRNHGVYVWGDSWITAKTQAECYHYVFDAAIKLHQLGVDRHGSIHNINGIWGCGVNFGSSLKAGSLATDYMIEPSQHIILLDVEGTTTPLSFVSNNLFAYAHNNVGNHLPAIYEETQDDIDLLRSQVQGRHIWRTGFQNHEMVGVIYDDVPEALARWHAGRIKVYIYSSCSREAQQLLFANTNYGDLRKYFSGYFDTTVGEKNEIRSYIEILRTVGVDRAADMLYVTAGSEEAVAALAAGLEVVISVRPGNGALTENHGFRMIKSLLEI